MSSLTFVSLSLSSSFHSCLTNPLRVLRGRICSLYSNSLHICCFCFTSSFQIKSLSLSSFCLSDYSYFFLFGPFYPSSPIFLPYLNPWQFMYICLSVCFCVCACSILPALLTDKAVLFIPGTTCVSCPATLFGWSGLPAHRKHTPLISGTHTHTHTYRNPPRHSARISSREVRLCTSADTHNQAVCDLICGEWVILIGQSTGAELDSRERTEETQGYDCRTRERLSSRLLYNNYSGSHCRGVGSKRPDLFCCCAADWYTIIAIWAVAS